MYTLPEDARTYRIIAVVNSGSSVWIAIRCSIDDRTMSRITPLARRRTAGFVSAVNRALQTSVRLRIAVAHASDAFGIG